jgi:xylan 1,4-beta-xylosidase
VTRRKDGTLAIAVWNLVDPGDTGTDRTVRLTFQHLGDIATAIVTRVDSDHSNTLRAYRTMGSPLDPTEEQVETLNGKTAAAPSQPQSLVGGSLDLMLQPNALALVEIRAGK